MKTARELHGPVVTGVVELAQGAPGFIICIPIYTGTKYEGCIAGIFEAQTLFDRYLPATVAAGYAIAISEEGGIFYERYPSPEPANKDWVSNSTMEQARPHGTSASGRCPCWRRRWIPRFPKRFFSLA